MNVNSCAKLWAYFYTEPENELFGLKKLVVCIETTFYAHYELYNGISERVFLF